MDNSGNRLIEQLVLDPSFRAWVLASPEADADRWNAWENDHKEQVDLIRTAKALVLALKPQGAAPSDNQIEKEVSRIRRQIEEFSHPSAGRPLIDLPNAGPIGQGNGGRRLRPVKNPFYRRPWFRVAAAVIIAAFGLQWLLTESPEGPLSSASPKTEEQTLASGSYANLSDTVARITLPDQSVVYLHENSTIRYEYPESKRSVTLTGEAFFDVSRQPERPFLVHAGEIVTRVLGTSFRVRAWPGEREAEVSVKTGKVYVAQKDDASTALILSPNQRIKYDNKRHSLEKGLVDAPEPVWKPSVEKEYFRFDGTPLKEVFEELHKVYGIPIIYDERIVASCSLSATMGEESFFEKLELICKVVNASYQIIDGSVVVYAKGCL